MLKELIVEKLNGRRNGSWRSVLFVTYASKAHELTSQARKDGYEVIKVVRPIVRFGINYYHIKGNEGLTPQNAPWGDNEDGNAWFRNKDGASYLRIYTTNVKKKNVSVYYLIKNDPNRVEGSCVEMSQEDLVNGGYLIPSVLTKHKVNKPVPCYAKNIEEVIEIY